MSEVVQRTTLGVGQQHLIWKSTLTGAQYRWANDTWEMRFKQAPDWHSVKAGAVVFTVYAQAGERFLEVLDVG